MAETVCHLQLWNKICASEWQPSVKQTVTGIFEWSKGNPCNYSTQVRSASPQTLSQAFTEPRPRSSVSVLGEWELTSLEWWGHLCHICPCQFLAPVPGLASSITLQWMKNLASWVTGRNLSHVSHLQNLLLFNHQSLSAYGQPGQDRV